MLILQSLLFRHDMQPISICQQTTLPQTACLCWDGYLDRSTGMRETGTILFDLDVGKEPSHLEGDAEGGQICSVFFFHRSWENNKCMNCNIMCLIYVFCSSRIKSPHVSVVTSYSSCSIHWTLLRADSWQEKQPPGQRWVSMCTFVYIYSVQMR